MMTQPHPTGGFGPGVLRNMSEMVKSMALCLLPCALTLSLSRCSLVCWGVCYQHYFIGDQLRDVDRRVRRAATMAMAQHFLRAEEHPLAAEQQVTFGACVASPYLLRFVET